MEAEDKQELIVNICKKRKLVKSNEDFISELPDSLLHHVLSFLDMYYVVKTSILSRRWRHLWMSLPFLNFDEEVYNPYNMAEDRMTPIYVDFTEFVDKVLFLYKGIGIHTFRLRCDNYNKRISRHVSSWTRFAVSHNVEELDLKMNFSLTHFELPLCLFTCTSLTTLKLDMGSLDYPMHFYLPDSVDLPNLKNLQLTSVSFLNEECLENLFSACPNLETLNFSVSILDQVNPLNISSLQLKNLEIDSFYINGFNPSNYYKIRLSTPNLTSFKCSDYILNDYSLENVSSLVKADIDKVIDLNGSTETKKVEEAQNVIKCLRGIDNILSLTLSAWLLEVASNVRAGLETLLPSFHNLTFLKLKTSLSRDQKQAIIYLLDSCPNVETLVFEIIEVEVNSEPEVESVGAEFSSQCMLNHLKFVEVHGIRGTDNETEFLKFLLKSSKLLEKIIAFTSENQSPASYKRLERLTEELEHFQNPPRV